MPYIFAQKLGQLNAVTHLAKGLGNLAHLFWNQDIAHEYFHLCKQYILKCMCMEMRTLTFNENVWMPTHMYVQVKKEHFPKSLIPVVC